MISSAFDASKIEVRSRAGFTLVELLVVIGIISLLIAMLLPALKKARAMALDVKCKSQLRQISSALQFYTNDNRTYLPASEEWFYNDRTMAQPWAGIGRYLAVRDQGPGSGQGKVPTILSCPTLSAYRPTVTVTGLNYTMNRRASSCRWSYNAGAGPTMEPKNFNWTRLSRVRTASQTWSFFDGNTVWNTTSSYWSCPKYAYTDNTTGNTGWSDAVAGTIRNSMVYPHGTSVPYGEKQGDWANGRGPRDSYKNVAFVDGHVEAVRRSQFFDAWTNSTTTGSGPKPGEPFDVLWGNSYGY